METAVALKLDEIRPAFLSYAHYKIGKGRITLSARVDNGYVSVGIAYCCPQDHFRKALGREIAFGRREKGGQFSFVFARNDEKFGDQLRAEFEQFVLTVENAAPPFAFYGLKREIKKRNKIAAFFQLIPAVIDLERERFQRDCEAIYAADTISKSNSQDIRPNDELPRLIWSDLAD